MKGLPVSTGRKDLMASRWSEKKPLIPVNRSAHTQEVKNTPPSYSQQPAVADDVMKLTPIGNSSKLVFGT